MFFDKPTHCNAEFMTVSKKAEAAFSQIKTQPATSGPIAYSTMGLMIRKDRLVLVCMIFDIAGYYRPIRFNYSRADAGA